MDEIEFRQKYNEAVTAADAISGPETKKAVMLVLQLINGLNVRVDELQTENPDEC